MFNLSTGIVTTDKHISNVRKGDEQMKKQTYMKPRVIGSADVHPC